MADGAERLNTLRETAMSLTALINAGGPLLKTLKPDQSKHFSVKLETKKGLIDAVYRSSNEHGENVSKKGSLSVHFWKNTKGDIEWDISQIIDGNSFSIEGGFGSASFASKIKEIVIALLPSTHEPRKDIGDIMKFMETADPLQKMAA